ASPAGRLRHADDANCSATLPGRSSGRRRLFTGGLRMRVRFFQVMTLACILAGAFAGVARALDFDDEDPQPVQTEVGRVLEYVIGTHAGCLPHRLEIQSGSLPAGTTLLKTQSPEDQTAPDHHTF